MSRKRENRFGHSLCTLGGNVLFFFFLNNRCYSLLLKQDKSETVEVQECVCLLYKHTIIISNKASRPRSGHG